MMLIVAAIAVVALPAAVALRAVEVYLAKRL